MHLAGLGFCVPFCECFPACGPVSVLTKSNKVALYFGSHVPASYRRILSHDLHGGSHVSVQVGYPRYIHVSFAQHLPHLR